MDDGPRTESEVLEMCQQAWNEGIRAVAVTAHQNEYWPNTPAQIIAATERLREQLAEISCEMELAAVGEVIVGPDTVAQLENGELLTYGNHGKHLLLEYPHGLFLDIRDLVSQLMELGIQPVLAHAERYPQLLADEPHLRDLIDRGCLIQISTTPFTAAPRRFLASRNSPLATLKHWLTSGLVHVICSDAHSPNRRPVQLRDACQTIEKWCGPGIANRICQTNGLALLRGKDVEPITTNKVKKNRWSLSRLNS